MAQKTVSNEHVLLLDLGVEPGTFCVKELVQIKKKQEVTNVRVFDNNPGALQNFTDARNYITCAGQTTHVRWSVSRRVVDAVRITYQH